MTLDSWNASQGTIDLHAAMARNDVVKLGLSQLRIDAVERTESQDTYAIYETHVNRSTAKSHELTVTTVAANRASYDFYFAHDTYLESLDSFQLSTLTDIRKSLKRLGKSSVTTVDDKTNKTPYGLIDISPATMWGATNLNPVTDLEYATGLLMYSEVTAEPDQTNPGNTIYRYTATKPDTEAGGEWTFTVSESFNADGLLTQKVVQEFSSGDFYLYSLEQNFTPEAAAPIAVPSASKTVAYDTLLHMGYRMWAEQSIEKDAANIARTAKTLAKVSKKPLAMKHLTAAAKALKLKVKSIKNGVKLSAKALDITGNLCIVIKKNKTASAPC
jgi:hypothetical protein